MLKLIGLALALSAILVGSNSSARADSLVVSVCGTLPQAYLPGATRLDTVDVNGNKCTSGGGGGGAVTIADGADVTLGAKADSVCGTSTGTCSLEALIKYLNTQAALIVTNTGAAIPPQSSAVPIGGVGICDGANGATNPCTTAATVKPVSTAPVTATDKALVVGLRPDSPGIIALGPNTAANSVPVVNTPSGNTAAGITPVVCGSAVSSCVLKNAAGSLYSVYADCTASCWLMVFNAASAPSNGATTAGSAASNMTECISIPAGSIGGINYGLGPPAVYSTGITAVISSTACATLTLSTVGFIHGMQM